MIDPEERLSTPPDRAPPSVMAPSDAAVFEAFVVPRYLSLFGDLALELLALVDGAQVIHIGCRTGYPDRRIVTGAPGAHIVGCDASPHALELARVKAATAEPGAAEYVECHELPLPFAAASFSHALSLHPPADPASREGLFVEMQRLLTAHGQAIVALPMRGSFVEVGDLLREFALKNEEASLAQAIDNAMMLRPTVEVLTDELEAVGFEYVDVDLRPAVLSFEGGRDFVEDPVTRLLLWPEFRRNMGVDFAGAMAYVRDAIDKYWSDSKFELTVNVGCATGRRA